MKRAIEDILKDVLIYWFLSSTTNGQQKYRDRAERRGKVSGVGNFIISFCNYKQVGD